MDVSPKALREVEFRELRRGGGYHPEDVDQFIEEVAKGVEVLQDRLRQAVERAQRAEAAASEATGSDETLRRTLVLAQRTADLAVQEARDQASRILAGAEQQAQSLIAESEQRARRTYEDTVSSTRAELVALEATRQRAQAEIDGMQRWVDEHRDRLVANLEEAIAAVERTGTLGPVPTSTPISPGSGVRAVPNGAVPNGQVPADGAAPTPAGATPVPTAATPPQTGVTASPGGTMPPPPSGTNAIGGWVGGGEGMGTTSRQASSAIPGPPDPGSLLADMPASASASASAPGADPATVAHHQDPGAHDVPTGEVPVVSADEGHVIDVDAVGSVGDAADDPDAQALDDFFQGGDYTDERRFGGRLRRRR